MQEWATEELKQADLGDARRTKRLIRIVEDLSAQPASSVPQACGNIAATYAAYDFWSSPYFERYTSTITSYWAFAAKTCEITSNSGT